jgi:hypothetical protein
MKAAFTTLCCTSSVLQILSHHPQHIGDRKTATLSSIAFVVKSVFFLSYFFINSAKYFSFPVFQTTVLKRKDFPKKGPVEGKHTTDD